MVEVKWTEKNGVFRMIARAPKEAEIRKGGKAVLVHETRERYERKPGAKRGGQGKAVVESVVPMVVTSVKTSPRKVKGKNDTYYYRAEVTAMPTGPRVPPIKWVIDPDAVSEFEGLQSSRSEYNT